MPRRARRQAPALLRRTAVASLALLICVAPELMGGLPAWSSVAITLAAPITAVLAGLAYGRGPSLRHPVSAVGLGVACLVVAQAMPLPIEMVDLLQPWSAAAVRESAALLDAAPPTTATLSLAPVATRRLLAEGLAVACVLFAAWSASANGGRRWVVRSVSVSVLTLALVIVAHAALDLRRPFGIGEEPTWDPAFIGPLLNQNHVAAVLAAGVPLLIAWALEGEGAGRWMLLVSAAAVALLCVLSRSRGGVLSLSVGLIVVALLLRRAFGASGARTLLVVAIGLVVVAAGSAAVVLSDAWIADTRRGLPKIAIFAQSLDIIPHAPWLGVGRGGFAAAFVHLHGGVERPLHAENLVIAWVTQLGIPAAVIAIGALLVSLGRAAAAPTSASRAGAIAAVASFAAHDQFDYALELVGIGVLGAAVLGAAIAPSAATGEATPRGRYIVLVAGVVSFVVAGGLARPTLDLSVSSLRNDMIAALRARDWARIDALAPTAVSAHPAEPIFPLLIGHASVVQDRDDTLLWLNRVMVLAPEWYEPHHLAARWLAGRGAIEQAWLEVREVRRIEAPHAGVVGCAIAWRAGSSRHALRVLGDDPALLEALVGCSSSEDAARIDEALAARGQSGPLLRRAREALARGRTDEALGILAVIEEDTDRVAVLRSEALCGAGRPREAVDVIRARLAHARTSELVYRLAHSYAEAGDAAGMREAMSDMLAFEDGSPAALARQRLQLAELEASMGNQEAVVRALEDAHRFEPTGPALERILARSLETGDTRRAYLARRELCRRDGPTSEHCGERTGPEPQLPGLP